MKTVAIIGAGPSGLVTAKTLLRSKSCKYQVTIFEKTSDVGGLWAVRKERPYDGMLNPDMPTNLSRFNIGFSDLAWSSVGLQGHVPYWPRAWQVGCYLRAYTDKFIPKDVIRFNTKVTSVARANKNEASSTWEVKWESVADDGSSLKGEDIFDHLVVATGFFSSSTLPASAALKETDVKVAHSTKLRGLQDVVPDGGTITGKLLVVGGGMSGADATTVLAAQLSDAAYSPTGTKQDYSKLELVQLCPEAAYALPLAAPSDQDEPAAPHFLPLDLCMYRLERKPPGPIEMKVGQMPSEVIKTVHEAFQGLVGNQSDLGVPGLTYKDASSAAYVTLTEQYSGFIRSENIKVLTGRLESLKPESNTLKPDVTSVQVSYTNGKEKKTINNVVGIVFATGFTPQPSLDFLSQEVRDALEHDRHHNRLPILLDEHAILHSRVPGLAIVGFHEGAFWGSMEMAARLVEHRWGSQAQQNGADMTGERTTSHLKSLRQAMKNKEKDVPQYWMGDYVGMMEQIARETGIPRDDLDFPERSGPVAVARYTDDKCDQSETRKILNEYSKLLSDSANGALFVGRGSFLGLQGHWQMERTIISHLASMPSGALKGTASFHPRFPTATDFDFEYLYIEKGTFTMSNGLTMNATRRYVYRYNEETDKITVWFVKDDGKTVDYMYHGLAFDVESRKKGWLAKADHLCVADMYKSDYSFKFQGANLSTFGITHAVKGPKKDYVSESWYTR